MERTDEHRPMVRRIIERIRDNPDVLYRELDRELDRELQQNTSVLTAAALAMRAAVVEAAWPLHNGNITHIATSLGSSRRHVRASAQALGLCRPRRSPTTEQAADAEPTSTSVHRGL